MFAAIWVLALVLGQCLAEDHPWVPQPRDDNWLQVHEMLVNQTLAHGNDEQLVFIGDSITEGWSRGNRHGNGTWHQYYAPRHAYNYGVGGDKTEHVLYRIVNNEFKGLTPKVAVLMIGTNNLAHNTNEDIEHGIKEIIKQLETVMPSTKILLLAVIPKPDHWNQKAMDLNNMTKHLGDDKSVFFLDMWSAFGSADGKQNLDLYVEDKVHLNPTGYEVWHKNMEPLLAKLLGEESGNPWTPQPRDENWLKRHEGLVNMTDEHRDEERIVFIGDSITDFWSSFGKGVWDKYYQPRHAFNYGIGGDKTENVLFRIENKELDGLKPNVTVLMIGTNNLSPNTNEDIAKGVEEVLKQISVKMPSTKTILLSVLPRGEPLGPRVPELNALIKKFADEKTVFWLDMYSDFEVDGKLNTKLFNPDKLHPNAQGYEVWRMSMEPLLEKLLGENPWTPLPRDENWLKRHEGLVNLTDKHRDEERIVFIGDSITDLWANFGKEVWDKYYKPRHAFNYGIGGDKTEHVLYRIENKELDGLKPNVTVLMIGTNNLWTNSNEDIAIGVKEVLTQISVKMPSTKTILLSVLPRADNQDLGNKVPDVNALIKKFADEKTIFWQDITSDFEANGTFNSKLFNPDKLHPNAEGYEVWYNTMEPLLAKLLGEEVENPWTPHPKDETWMKRHESFVTMTDEHRDEERIVFIGDSITDNWSQSGKDVWAQYYQPRHAFNYGIGGDRTENVLFRIENKEFDGLNPNVTVLMIGTNNLIPNTIEDNAKGVKEVLRQISVKMPSTKTILLSVLPLGKPLRPEVPALNALIKEFADEKTVFWQNMYSEFLADGKLNSSLFIHDNVHPNADGYELWHKTMEPLLEKLLKE